MTHLKVKMGGKGCSKERKRRKAEEADLHCNPRTLVGKCTKCPLVSKFSPFPPFPFREDFRERAETLIPEHVAIATAASRP